MLTNYKCSVIFPQGILETVVTDMALKMTKLKLMLPHPRANESMQSMIYLQLYEKITQQQKQRGEEENIVSRDVGADHNTASDTTSSLETFCKTALPSPALWQAPAAGKPRTHPILQGNRKWTCLANY